MSWRPPSPVARVCALVVLLLALAVPSQAVAARDIPVGLANVNDQNLRDGSWLYAMRFVVDRDTTIYRFFSQMKAKGASWDEHPGAKCSAAGPGCYGAGDGGRIQARLVTVKPDGTPDLSNVLAQETVDPAARYLETKTQYGISTISLFWYFNMGGVAVRGGTPYAMVYRNVAPDPAHNFSSANSPTVRESEAGPNGRNNMDPNAPGAIAGLDPREAVAWSTDGGASWSWGRQVGPYFGSTTSDDGVRLPHYAWQATPISKPQSNQPYSAYWETCTGCTLTARAVPRATTLTEGGGYAPVGQPVGVVTVRNLRTGQTGRTAALGSGIARGRLDTPVRLEAGDSYEITGTGTVYKEEADNYIVKTVGIGSGAFPFTTSGQGADRAELFALPHPYYDLPAPAPAPAAGTPPAPPPPGVTPPDTSVIPAPKKKPQRGPRSASVRGVSIGSARAHGRVLRVRGRVAGGGARRVRLQALRSGRWRVVANARVRGGRFAFRLRTRTAAQALRVRVDVPRLALSKAIRVRLR